MYKAAYFCFGVGRQGRRQFFVGGAGRVKNPWVGRCKNPWAGQDKGRTLPGLGIFGAGQKDQKPIS